MTSNHFCFCVRLLGDIVVHFPTSQEEVTLSISSYKVALKTFYEEENGETVFLIVYYW